MQGTDWIVVATSTSERETTELSLVLAAGGFEYQRTFCDGVWHLTVPGAQAEKARVEAPPIISPRTPSPSGRRLR